MIYLNLFVLNYFGSARFSLKDDKVLQGQESHSTPLHLAEAGCSALS